MSSSTRLFPPVTRSVAIAALFGAVLLAGPLTASAAAPGTTYGNVTGNDSISFDSVGYGRAAIDQEASNYCGTHGKAAVYTGQIGSRSSYDCVPSAGVVNAPPAYAPATTYAPVPSYSTLGNGHNNPSISYDSTRYDRAAMITAANQFCAAQGRSAAFSGRNGALVNYDCVPNSDAAHAPVVAYVAPVAPAAPYVTFEYIGTNQSIIESEAANYCSAQGGASVFRGQDGNRVTYDCVIGQTQVSTAPAYVAYTDASATPTAVPTITYSMAGNRAQNDDAPAIRYCAMLGKSPYLRGEDGNSRTYECR
jgi:hypothetical protein